jgi:PAS domain S-box-containing protein
VAKIWLGAPLIIKEKVIGVIAIQSYQSEKDYETKDLNLLNSVSQHIALAIERKDADEKLGEQRQLLEKILESSPVGIALLENRIFKWVNNEMVKIFGYDSKFDFENQSVRMIYHSDQDYETVGTLISNELKAGGKSEFEFELKRKDHALFPARVLLAGFNSAHTDNGTIAIITDISAQKLAQQEKMEKEKLQGVLEMAGAICHELNQPLQTIIGYSSLLKTIEDVNEKDILSIRDQATRLGEITRRLSSITHYKTKAYAGNMKIVDIWKSSPNS